MVSQMLVFVYLQYSWSSKSGQPLCKTDKNLSPMSPLFGGSTACTSDVRKMVVSPGSCYSHMQCIGSPNTAMTCQACTVSSTSKHETAGSLTHALGMVYISTRSEYRSQCDSNCCYSYKNNVLECTRYEVSISHTTTVQETEPATRLGYQDRW